jgi:hypothetical protein
MEDFKTRVDKALSKCSPTTIVAGTAAAVVVGYLAAQVLSDPQGARFKSRRAPSQARPNSSIFSDIFTSADSILSETKCFEFCFSILAL